MKPNISQLNRYLRVILGILFLAYAIAGGPVWAYLGAVSLITGALAFCPIYAFIERQKNL